MTDDQTTNQTPEQEEAPSGTVSGPSTEEGTENTVDETTDTEQDDPETFPREYVQKLRDESAKYRQKAADRDALAERLHSALVAATGRLADPTDLAFNEDHLTDPDALTAAIDDLLDHKPHLASRRPVGDVGQGANRTDTAVDLAGILRRNAS